MASYAWTWSRLLFRLAHDDFPLGPFLKKKEKKKKCFYEVKGRAPVAGTGANPQREANLFVDTVLNVILPIESGTANASTAPLADLTVADGGPDLLVTLTNGSIKGQASLFKREEDCAPSRWEGSNITMRCDITFRELLAAYRAHTRLGNDTVDAAFLVTSRDRVPLLLTEEPGHDSEVRIELPSLLTVTKQYVNKKTDWCCSYRVRRAVTEEIRNFLVTHFWPVLSLAFQRIKLPYPV